MNSQVYQGQAIRNFIVITGPFSIETYSKYSFSVSYSGNELHHSSMMKDTYSLTYKNICAQGSESKIGRIYMKEKEAFLRG